MNDITINKSTNQDKKELKRFYKKNHYPLSFMGYDHTYKATLGTELVASVIISYINETNPKGLLHALIVSKEHQRKGYAQVLIKHVLQEHKHVICFADNKLTSLYRKAAFKEEALAYIPSIFTKKYISYLTKNRNLKIFAHNL